MPNMPGALVTGANGFIGSRMCAMLLKKKWKVWGFVRRTSDLSYLKGLDVKLVFDDVAQPVRLGQELKKVDFVFHVAGLTIDWGPYEIFHKANVIGTVNILKFAKAAKARKTVILSSLSVMGFGRTGMTEAHPRKQPPPPGVHYVTSKLAMEQEAMSYAEGNRMRVTILRPGDVYGEHDRTTSLPMFKALENGTMGFINSGKAHLSPLYVVNLCDAMLKAAESRNADGNIYNITDGIKINWNDYVCHACDCLGKPKPKLNVPYAVGYSIASVMEVIYKLFGSRKPPMLTKYRIMHGGLDYHFDIAAAKRELGYRPSQDIKANLRKTAEWYLSQKARKPKVLITGVSGFWGYSIAKYLAESGVSGYEILGLCHSSPVEIDGVNCEKLDITDGKKLKAVMDRFEPDIIIHTAAISRIADCEQDPRKAMAVNVDAVREIVRSANLYKSRLIYFSTDLVYSGAKRMWTEADALNPLHMYERTKVMAEAFITQNCYNYIILRTALSYGPPSPNHSSFLGWMSDGLRKGRKVSLYSDQFRTPICSLDGTAIIERLMLSPVKDKIVNFGGHERITRYAFGLKYAAVFGLNPKYLEPLRNADSHDPYKPSMDASMDTSLLRKLAGRTNSISWNLWKLKKEYQAWNRK